MTGGRRVVSRAFGGSLLTVEQAREVYGVRPIKRRGGDRIVVIRPSDPRVALAIITQAKKHDDAALLARAPLEAGCSYRFLGWWAVMPSGVAERYVVDVEGTIVDTVEGGDAAVTESSIRFESHAN